MREPTRKAQSPQPERRWVRVCSPNESLMVLLELRVLLKMTSNSDIVPIDPRRAVNGGDRREGEASGFWLSCQPSLCRFGAGRRFRWPDAAGRDPAPMDGSRCKRAVFVVVEARMPAAV